MAGNIVYPTNHSIPFTIAYENKHHSGLDQQRLEWRIAGGGMLRRWYTLTNGRGRTVNHVMVPMADPTESTTIQISVWPWSEPEAVLEVALEFGLPSGLADATDEDGNTLSVVNPRDGLSATTTGSNRMYSAYIGYTTGDGQSIVGQEIQTVITSGIAPSTTDNPSTLAPYTPIVSGFDSSALKNKTINVTAQRAALDGQEPLQAHSNFYCQGATWATATYDMLFPRDGTTLLSGEEYPVRALLAIPFGGTRPQSNTLTKFEVLSGSASITPETQTDEFGMAEGTIIGAMPSNGGTNSVTIRTSTTDGSIYVDATYNFRADSIFLIPDPEPVYEANTAQSFAVAYTDGLGQPIEGAEVFWYADEKHSSFNVPVTYTDAQGKSSNVLNTCNVPQGEIISVPVRAVTDQAATQATYRFGANKLILATPAAGTVSPIQYPIEFSARYTTYDDQPIAGEYVYWSTTPTPGDDTVNLVYKKSRTDNDGYARTAIYAETDITIALTCKSGNACELPTTAPFTFGQNHLTILSPKTSDTLQLDTWVPVTAQFLDPSYGPVRYTTLKWAGGDFEQAESDTNGSGIAQNMLRVETLSGYPTAPIIQNITVSSSAPKASTTQPLTFDLSADSNSLVVLSPTSGAELPSGQWIDVTAQLQNVFAHNLANYNLVWSSDDGIIFDSSTSTTNSNGLSSVKMMVPNSNNGNWPASLTVVAGDAKANGSAAYIFVNQSNIKSAMVGDKTYAHNYIGTQPTGDDQIITFTCRYVENGLPVPNEEIEWYCSSNTTYLYYMNEDGVQIEPDKYQRIQLPTNENGECILKLASPHPFTGYMYAVPPNSVALNVRFTIATVMLSNNMYRAPRTQPDPLVIPQSSPGQATFQFLAPAVPPGQIQAGSTVVIYIQSGGQESILYSDYGTVSSPAGALIPYSELEPGPNTRMAYWVESGLSDLYQSDVIEMTVTGTQQRPGPDPTIQDRTLLAPYLSDNSTIVNGTAISGGLVINIPYTTWKTGDTISGAVYLNGYAGNTTQPKWATVLYGATIGVNDEGSGQPLSIIVPQDQLDGYGYPAGGRPGTLESDYSWYSVDSNMTTWSMVLRDVQLDTASLG